MAESEAEASRRSSFLKIVSLGKLKRESMSDKASQEAEEETVEDDPVVKTREPLSGNYDVNIKCEKKNQHLSNDLEDFSELFPLLWRTLIFLVKL